MSATLESLTESSLEHASLKRRHRLVREKHPTSLTLRIQLIHGGATWNGKVNHDQLRDCTQLLSKLVPLIIVLMMDNPDALWGNAVYPVIDQDA